MLVVSIVNLTLYSYIKNTGVQRGLSLSTYLDRHLHFTLSDCFQLKLLELDSKLISPHRSQSSSCSTISSSLLCSSLYRFRAQSSNNNYEHILYSTQHLQQIDKDDEGKETIRR